MRLFSKHANSKEKQKPTFEEQLETFKQLGFELNPDVNISDVNSWAEENRNHEFPVYQLLYQILGSTIEREPWTPVTDKCWNFDTEAIEDHGAYIDIMKNISRITKGELIFFDIKDYVDIEEETAWVSFTCNGDYYKWDLKVDNDWVDGDLFDKVQQLAYKYNTKGKFTYFDTGGQNFVLGYATTQELENIRKATGLEIVWLSAKGQVY